MNRYETTENQRTQLALLGMEDADFHALRNRCDAENLSVDAWSLLACAAIQIADFERHDKPQRQTQKQRLDALKAVEESAVFLSTAIQGLSNGDLIRLDSRLFLMGVGPPKNALQVSTAGTAADDPFMRADWAACTAGAIATAARLMLSEATAAGVTGLGRKRTVEAYAGHIAAIAHQLMPHGIKPGDNGRFRRICDAVFSAAGVPATSQGAIKLFLADMRPDMKERGLCL